MKKLRYIIVLVCLFSTSLSFAQVAYVEEKAKVNSIKKNADYVYGEGIADTEQEALELAEQSLRSEIMRLISESKTMQDEETILVNAIKKNSSRIKLKRGTMDRVFLYVEKENILLPQQVMTINRDIIDKEKEDISVVEEDLIAEETLLIEEVADILMEEETKTETNQPDTPISNENLLPTLKALLLCNSKSEFMDYLRKQKEVHKVMWGNVASDINPAWYIGVFTEGKPVAVFDKGLQTRLNLLNGQRESLAGYGKSEKVWFIVYE